MCIEEAKNNALDQYLEYIGTTLGSGFFVRLFVLAGHWGYDCSVCLGSPVLQMFLNSLLVVITDLAAALLGNVLFRRHFHLFLSAVVLFGPLMNLWVSHYSIFAKKSHYLYR